MSKMQHETNFEDEVIFISDSDVIIISDSDVILISDVDEECEVIDLEVSDDNCPEDHRVVVPQSRTVKRRERRRRVGRGMAQSSPHILTGLPYINHTADTMLGRAPRTDIFREEKCLAMHHTTSPDLSPDKANKIQKSKECSKLRNGQVIQVEHKKKPNKKFKKKKRMTTSPWASSDDDFDDESISPSKRHFYSLQPALHRHQISPRNPAMLSVSSPLRHGFPSLGYGVEMMKPKTATLHHKHGRHSDSSSGSDSDLPDPCLFMHGHQRSSTTLSETYSPFKACKREPEPGLPSSPQKKTKVSPAALTYRDDSWETSNQGTPDKSKWHQLIDVSSSEGEFESCDKRIMRTPSKLHWQRGNSPCKKQDLHPRQRLPRTDQPVGVPIHISILNAASRKSSLKSKVSSSSSDDIWDFCPRQHNMIEAVVDEDFTDEAIVFIRDFATLHRGAPEQYMMYLLKDVLLTDEMEDFTVISAYEALMHIHSLHPTAATSLTLDWDFITTIVKKLNLETTTDNTKTPHLAHLLALQFILVILMDDFQAMKRKNMLKKSYSYSLLSADMCLGHIRNVIQWICLVVTNKLRQNPTKPEDKDQDTSGERNVWEFLKQIKIKPSTEPKPETVERDSWKAPIPESYYTVLELLQKMLLLSFSIGMNSSALKIAEELLYPYLYVPSLEQRKICLQTLTCDPIRSKLIELLLENLCETNAIEQQGVLTVRKIVECHFKSRPMRVKFVQAERDQVVAKEKGGGGGGKSLGNQRQAIGQEECEELAMLLFFLLQSYVRNRTVKSSSGDAHLSRSPEFSQSSPPFQSALEPWLSIDDRECLCQMGDHVEALERHLRAHCNHLTPRTRLYLAQMEAMRDLAF